MGALFLYEGVWIPWMVNINRQPDISSSDLVPMIGELSLEKCLVVWNIVEVSGVIVGVLDAL